MAWESSGKMAAIHGGGGSNILLKKRGAIQSANDICRALFPFIPAPAFLTGVHNTFGGS
jgi:hypothetical protein